jgi:hypothetical protein
MLHRSVSPTDETTAGIPVWMQTKCELLQTCLLESLISATLFMTEFQPLGNLGGLGNSTHFPKRMVLINGTNDISKKFRVSVHNRLSFGMQCNLRAKVSIFFPGRDVQELEIHDKKMLRHFMDSHQRRGLPSTRHVLSIRCVIVGIVRLHTNREPSFFLLPFMHFSYKTGNAYMRNQQTSRQLLVMLDFSKSTY